MSGKKNNNFTRTCSRLSQFLREKRSLRDQNCFVFPQIASLPSSSKQIDSKKFKNNLADIIEIDDEEEETKECIDRGNEKKSFDLFPLTAISTDDKSPQLTTNIREPTKATEEPNKACPSMTIFYGGRVLVFDEFPEEKAQEIMDIASKLSTTRATKCDETQDQTKAMESPSTANKELTMQHGQDTDLPIARRTSLFRFMEKRKDRGGSVAPYQPRNPAMVMANPHPPRLIEDLYQQQKEEKHQQLQLKL